MLILILLVETTVTQRVLVLWHYLFTADGGEETAREILLISQGDFANLHGKMQILKRETQ